MAENDIIIRDVTNEIQQTAVYLNYEITSNVAKVQEEGTERNRCLAKM